MSCPIPLLQNPAPDLASLNLRGECGMLRMDDCAQKDLLIKVKPRNKKIRQPSAAHDKQHSNAGQNTARATEGIAKQAQPALAETE